MILQALKQYYDRLTCEKDPVVPLYGFSEEKIDFDLVLNSEGDVVSINELGVTQGNKRIRRSFIVPKVFSGTKGNGIKANLLWEETGYIFGKGSNKGDNQREIDKFKAFKTLHFEIGQDVNDDGMNAVLKFLNKRKPQDTSDVDNWEAIAGKKLVFRFEGDLNWIFERDTVRKAIEKYIIKQLEGTENSSVNCLITGKQSPIERLHPGIKNIRGADQAELKIISFQKQKTAFCSYGRDGQQGSNSPCSKLSAFAYGAALNYLTKNRVIQIGDATTVFWSEKPSALENILSEIFNPTQEDPISVKDVQRFLKSVRDGKKPKEINEATKFYILGLSPNASRLSIRFWYAGNVGELSERIGRHFNDIAIERQFDKDNEFPGLWEILVNTAVQNKTNNINPLLGGELARAIFTQGYYPKSMLSALIGRIRAGEEINYLRSAMIKGILVRNYRKEVSMSLDKSNKESAYLLGRLFAVLEKAQQDALGGLNATIKDKYYSSASATPRSTYPILLRINKHHTSKGDHGSFYDSLNAEILEQLPAQKFPSHLTLEEQGLFAIGYYHQRNDFYKKKKTKNENEN